MRLYRDANGDGKSQDAEEVVGVSQQGTDGLRGDRCSRTRPASTCCASTTSRRVEDYTLTVTYEGPPPYRPAQQETYTLTCERDGAVLATQPVLVERGEAKTLSPCPAARAEPSPGRRPRRPRPPAPPRPGSPSVGLRRSGRGLRFDLTPRAGGAATVSVFQQSSGRRITGERLRRALHEPHGLVHLGRQATQKGRSVTDGYYFVRYRLGDDTRRIALRRSNGRFTKVGDFYRRATCDLVPSYKLIRPVFGGTRTRALGISYVVAKRAR